MFNQSKEKIETQNLLNKDFCELDISLQNALKNIKINVYKVQVRTLHTGTRIESFSCKSKSFLDKTKAIKYAYELAQKYAKNNGLPLENCELSNGLLDISSDDLSKISQNNLDKNKYNLKITNSYKWPDDGGYCEEDKEYYYKHEWFGYSIEIYNEFLDFNNDVVCTTYFGV